MKYLLLSSLSLLLLFNSHERINKIVMKIVTVSDKIRNWKLWLGISKLYVFVIFFSLILIDLLIIIEN